MASALFLLLLAIGALLAGGGYVQKARSMRHFRSTRGTVLSRAVVPVPSGDTTEGRFGDGGGYMPGVTYRYTVDGVAYTGDRVAYAYRGLKKTVAERALAAIGDDVDVWYDPARPSEAYLQRHTPTLGWALVALGAIFGLVAGVWLIGLA